MSIGILNAESSALFSIIGFPDYDLYPPGRKQEESSVNLINPRRKTSRQGELYINTALQVVNLFLIGVQMNSSETICIWVLNEYINKWYIMGARFLRSIFVPYQRAYPGCPVVKVTANSPMYMVKVFNKFFIPKQPNIRHL